ncbi:hypothetical protein GJ744_002643 [Endocarpon pusillum]|uniref:Uncharacterized protein n=1 Tax=Endocarpon pusillum TaxID=364733 RepID=A0A8H7AF97_9EURO|nr:hypothetical protein GJ744_002643 [Endocarpon pusillum]
MDFRALFVESEKSTRRSRSSGFQKVVKFVDRLHFTQARDHQILTAQNTKLAESRAKQTKKAIKHPNEQFANIEDIQRAQELARGAQKEKERKEAAIKAKKVALERFKELHPAEWLEKEAKKAAAMTARQDFANLCSSWHISEKNAE